MTDLTQADLILALSWASPSPETCPRSSPPAPSPASAQHLCGATVWRVTVQRWKLALSFFPEFSPLIPSIRTPTSSHPRPLLPLGVCLVFPLLLSSPVMFQSWGGKGNTFPDRPGHQADHTPSAPHSWRDRTRHSTWLLETSTLRPPSLLEDLKKFLANEQIQE